MTTRHPNQNRGRPVNAAKRDLVRATARAYPHLDKRALARRCGVSVPSVTSYLRGAA